MFLRLTSVKKYSEYLMKVFSTVLLFLFSSFSQAEDLIDLEISINQMSSYYRAVIFFDGDDKYKTPLLTIASQASKFDGILEDKPQLAIKWKALISHVNLSFEEGSSVHNSNVQANWTLKTNELNNALNENLKDNPYNGSFNDPKSVDYVRLALLRMEKILTAYMALTNSVGSYGIYAESNVIEIQVAEVSKMLDLLDPQNDALKRVVKKWKFIKRVLLKYNTNVAPFVVLHGYDKMRKDISKYLASPQ
jgi:hypothetical protein